MKRPVLTKVVSVVVAAAAISLMGVGWSRHTRQRALENELAAIGTLRHLAGAQNFLRAKGLIDRNGDGRGEFGALPDMYVEGPDRMAWASAACVDIEERSALQFRSRGYWFRIYLPDANAQPVIDGAAADPVAAETMWCAYAWPVRAGVTGNRTFFIEEGCDATAAFSMSRRYDGLRSPPHPLAGYARGARDMRSPIAVASEGWDGLTWYMLG